MAVFFKTIDLTVLKKMVKRQMAVFFKTIGLKVFYSQLDHMVQDWMLRNALDCQSSMYEWSHSHAAWIEVDTIQCKNV